MRAEEGGAWRDLIARRHYTGPGSLDAETSAATLTLFLISMWVLVIVARPYTWWRVTLVAAMGVAFLFVLIAPSSASSH